MSAAPPPDANADAGPDPDEDAAALREAVARQLEGLDSAALRAILAVGQPAAAEGGTARLIEGGDAADATAAPAGGANRRAAEEDNAAYRDFLALLLPGGGGDGAGQRAGAGRPVDSTPMPAPDVPEGQPGSSSEDVRAKLEAGSSGLGEIVEGSGPTISVLNENDGEDDKNDEDDAEPQPSLHPSAGVDQANDIGLAFVTPSDTVAVGENPTTKAGAGAHMNTRTATIEQLEGSEPRSLSAPDDLDGKHSALAAKVEESNDNAAEPSPVPSHRAEDDAASKKVRVVAESADEPPPCPDFDAATASGPAKEGCAGLQRVDVAASGGVQGADADLEDGSGTRAGADAGGPPAADEGPADATGASSDAAGDVEGGTVARATGGEPNASYDVEEGPGQAAGDEHGDQGQDQDTIVVPHAYIPEDDASLEVYTAEPLLPWHKQRKVRMLFCLVIAVILAAAIAVGASFSVDRTVTEAVFVTSAPSTSAVPSPAPTTSPPTLAPTEVPSSSRVPSVSPTSCAYTISKAIQTLELPLNDPSNVQFEVDGRDAVVVAQDGDSASVHVVFYALDVVEDAWFRTAIFVEEVEDIEGSLWGYRAALSGGTALVGLPQTDTLAGPRAGAVRLFERDDEGAWERAPDPLVSTPDGGRAGANFGHYVDLDGDRDGALAVVGAHYEEAFYIFEKVGSDWVLRSRHDVGYEIFGCRIVGDTVLGVDFYMAELHLYAYDRDRHEVTVLQEPLSVEPQARDFGSVWAMVTATGAADSLLTGLLGTDYVAYSVSRAVSKGGAIVWEPRGVYVYKRRDGQRNFVPHQLLHSSDYEDGFGWEIAMDRDILVVSGWNSTRFFSDEGGEFKVSFALDEAYERLRLQGRQMMAAKADLDEVNIASVEDCAQLMPTQTPSTSLMPTNGNLLTPSLLPSGSLPPSKSASPSHECHDVFVFVFTVGATDPETFEGDYLQWKLYEQTSGAALLQGGPLQTNRTYAENVTCLESGTYVFDMTSSRGNGFGACEGFCASGIFYNGVESDRLLGVINGAINPKWYNEKFTFSLPPHKLLDNDEKSEEVYRVQCAYDFVFQIHITERPEEITWQVVDEGGQLVLSGGPYEQHNMIYTEWACLEYGTYNFTIFDAGEEGDAIGPEPGLYFVGINGGGDFIFDSALDFGASQTVTLVWEPPSKAPPPDKASQVAPSQSPSPLNFRRSLTPSGSPSEIKVEASSRTKTRDYPWGPRHRRDLTRMLNGHRKSGG